MQEWVRQSMLWMAFFGILTLSPVPVQEGTVPARVVKMSVASPEVNTDSIIREWGIQASASLPPPSSPPPVATPAPAVTAPPSSSASTAPVPAAAPPATPSAPSTPSTGTPSAAPAAASAPASAPAASVPSVDTKKEKKDQEKAAKKKEKEKKKEAKKPAKPQKIFVTGSVLNRYRLRTTEGLRDQDLDTLFSLNVNDPVIDHLSGSLQVGSKFDLDGSQKFTDFSGIYDTFDQDVVPRIYYGYMDIRKYKPVAHVRVGRQHIYELEHFYFDGALIETVPIYGFTLTTFGGMPVHFYENQIGSDWGDWTAGGLLQWHPIARLRFRFDYVHVEDDLSPFSSMGTNQADDFFAWSTWYDVNAAKTIVLASKVGAFSDQLRDAGAQIDFSFPKHKLLVRGRAYRLLEGYDIRVTDFDALHIAGTYQPYTEVGASATKELGEKFSVDGGFVKRFLDDEQTVSAFNHGFDKGFMTLSSYSVPWKGLNLSLTGDFYFGRDSSRKNNSFATSFAASQNLLKDRLEIEAGTSYYLYRYNLISENESDDVRVYFSYIEAQLRKGLDLKLMYEFEDNDFGNYQSVTSTLRWDF